MMSRNTGICTNLYSLRSHRDSGIGDMGDTLLLVNLACALGLDKVVLSAISDTAFGGDGPISPIYMDLRSLDFGTGHTKAAAYKILADNLNSLPRIDYARVYSAKMHCLRELFLMDGSRTLSGEDYHTFWKENRAWLESYSVFCTLRHKYGTGDSRYWSEPDYARLLEDINFIKEYSDDMRFHLYVQFLLHSQLKDAMDYAAAKGVILSVCNETSRNVFLREWWANLPSLERAAWYNDRLGFADAAPKNLEPWVAEAVIREKLANSASDIILAPEDWLTMTSLQSLESSETPATKGPSDDRQYRMDISLEDILSHRALLDSIRTVVADYDE